MEKTGWKDENGKGWFDEETGKLNPNMWKDLRFTLPSGEQFKVEEILDKLKVCKPRADS